MKLREFYESARDNLEKYQDYDMTWSLHKTNIQEKLGLHIVYDEVFKVAIIQIHYRPDEEII